jgi:hypothetical protein
VTSYGFDGAAGDPNDAEDDDPGGDALDNGEADAAESGRCPNYGIDQTRTLGGW